MYLFVYTYLERHCKYLVCVKLMKTLITVRSRPFLYLFFLQRWGDFILYATNGDLAALDTIFGTALYIDTDYALCYLNYAVAYIGLDYLDRFFRNGIIHFSYSHTIYYFF